MIDDSTGAARGGIPSGGSAGFLAVDSIAPAVTPPRFVPVSVPPASSIGGFARDSSEMSERNAAETLMTRLVCGTAIVLAGTLIGTVTDAAGLSEGAATLGSMAGAAMASVGGGEAMVSGIVVLAEKAGGFLRSAGDAVRSFRDSRGAGIARLNGLAGAAAMLETSAGRMHVLRTDADGWRLVSAEEFARATSRGDVAVASVGRSGVRLSHLTDGRPESRISEDGTVIPAFSDFFVDLDPLLEAALESIVQEAIDSALLEVYGGPNAPTAPQVWLYRGAWQEWPVTEATVLVPLSQEELTLKIQAIFKHQSQKDSAPFPGQDAREFWQRVEQRNKATSAQLDQLGLAEYFAMEAYVIA